MGAGEALKQIRSKFNVKAYNGVKIRTETGEIGVIVGAKGFTLKVYFEGKSDPKYLNPDDVAYLGFILK